MRGFEGSIYGDLQLLQIGIVLLAIYAVLILGKFHPIESRTLLAVGGLASVGFAYIEAVGICTYFGLKSAGPHNVIPFLLLGIGLDDMFVLIGCIPSDPDMPVPEKMEACMKKAGVSITITSFTSFLAFMLGGTSTLPALSSFCIFASMGLLFDYLNQITFFACLLAFDMRRSERKYPDCFGACRCDPRSCICCNGKLALDEEGKIKKSWLRKFLSDKYVPFITKFPVNIIIILCFVGLLVANCYGVSQLELEFDEIWMVEDDSFAKEMDDRTNKWWPDESESVNFYTVEADFTT